MRIGIIGTGQIGGTLARRFTALGHQVFVANSRGPASLADLARESGATPVSVSEAAHSGDVVIVTIPEKNIPHLPADLFAGVPDSVVVVDTGNYYPQQRDGRIDGIEAGATESRWVAQQLGRPVVKAFNNIYAQHLMDFGKPADSENRQTRKNRLQCEMSAGVWNCESSDRIKGCDGTCIHAGDSLAGVAG